MSHTQRFGLAMLLMWLIVDPSVATEVAKAIRIVWLMIGSLLLVLPVEQDKESQ